jgi:alpha-D-ribose 1-methylphosphonate 5-triphosphate diphosphatase
MPDLDLVGAEVLGPEGLRRETLSFAEGRIVDAPVGRAVDLAGCLVLPGIVDLHGDGFERHLAPRRGAMKELGEGLAAVDAELGANGITTALLAQFVSWEGGLRGADFADAVFNAIRETGPSLVSDLRPHLRFETHLLEHYGDLPERLAGWGIDHVIFSDHLPHDRLAAAEAPKNLVGQALKAGRSPEAHLELMMGLHATSDEVPDALDWLCKRLAAQGVRMGSHDDRTAEERAAWRARGVTLAEFPETLTAAEAAVEAGDTVLMGAPNVVRGGSHRGNLSALDLVAMGGCDALASDYHYPAPRRAALLLASGVTDFASAWALVSDRPARVLGLTDRGRLAPGLRADIVVLDAVSGRVGATLAGGRLSYLAGDMAERFLAAQ